MGHMPCGTHAERPARFCCRPCNVYACADCAKHTWVRDHFEDRCPRCGAAMEPLEGLPADHGRGPAALAARLPELWSFLRQPSLLMMLAGLALLVAPLSWGVQHNISPLVSLLGYALIIGLELSIYVRIVVQTAYGEDEITPPELSDIHADLIAPTVRFLAAMLPIVAGALWYAEQAYEGSWLLGLTAFQLDPLSVADYPGPLLVVAAGVLLLPLLTVVAALSTSALSVLNPLAAVNNLRVLGATYWVGAGVFYAVLLVEKLLLARFLWWLLIEVDIPVLSRLLVIFIGYLPFAVRARVLGLMVRPYVQAG